MHTLEVHTLEVHTLEVHIKTSAVLTLRVHSIGKIRISDFAIECEIQKQISFLRYPSSWPIWITVRLGNPKKDLQNYSREQQSSFC